MEEALYETTIVRHFAGLDYRPEKRPLRVSIIAPPIALGRVQGQIEHTLKTFTHGFNPYSDKRLEVAGLSHDNRDRRPSVVAN